MFVFSGWLASFVASRMINDRSPLADDAVIDSFEHLKHGALSLGGVPQSNRRAAAESMRMHRGEPTNGFGLGAECLYRPSQ